MKKKSNLKRRLLSIGLSAVFILTGIPTGFGAVETKAAETGQGYNAGSGNALKALGINSDVLPDGYDPDDDITNPYGKKTVTGTVSDEVYMANMGVSGYTLIGNDRSTLTGRTYTYANAGSLSQGKNVITYLNNSIYNNAGVGERGTYISDIIVSGGGETEAQNAIRNSGYNLIGIDLNYKAGGDFIYLGYKTTTDPEQAITDLLILNNPGGGPPNSIEISGKDYYRAPITGGTGNSGDLNHKAGGQFIWLYYTKGKDANGFTPITNLYVTYQNNPGNDSIGGYYCNYNPWSSNTEWRNNADMNGGCGTSSATIHIHRSRVQLHRADIEGTRKSAQNSAPLSSAYMNKTAGGSFDGKADGKKAQFAMVRFDTDNQKTYLSVVDTKETSIQTTDKSKQLGWNTSQAVSTYRQWTYMSNANANKIQAIAYMSIVTGDFDGNGIDEIAVYNPKSDAGARIEVYGLTSSPDKCDIRDMSNWEIRSTISAKDDNFVSMDAGDLNQDGIDDLVVGCDQAVTIYHGSRKLMLDQSRSVDLTAGGVMKGRNFYDPSVVVFCEKVAGKLNTYLGILSKTTVTSTTSYGSLSVCKYNAMKKEYETVAYDKDYRLELNTFNSGNATNYTLRMPLELHYVNHCFLTSYEKNDRALSFQDGVLTVETGVVHPKIQYNRDADNNNSVKGAQQGLIPYDFQVSDLNGDGVQTVFYHSLVMTESHYRPNLYVDTYGNNPLKTGYYTGAYSPGSAEGPMMPLNVAEKFYNGTPAYYGNPGVFAILNTDDDTMYMNYTGKHSVEYTDPEVLAVLSSPPYFKDLLANDELSGNYPESTTSYGKTTGSGQSVGGSATISAGVFERVEQEISILGLGNVAQVEAEVSWTASFTAAYEQESSLEYSVEYATSSGADAVVLYSIPTEIYEYETFYIDRKTGKKQSYKKSIFFPKTPCVTTMELEKYNTIAENYTELPRIDESVLNHTLGFPESYPESSGSYSHVREFDGNWMAVDFTSAGGGMTQSQSIEMSKENETSFSAGVEMSFSAGAGAGGVTLGVTGGAAVEAGYAMTNTSGNSFTAEMQNMPKEAEDYGYGMSWKLFAHEGSYTNRNGKTVKFPVVDYLVTDVVQPPLVPENLHQDYDESTPNSIALEWDYEDITRAGRFDIYRLHDINGRKAVLRVGSIGVKEGTKNEDGSYTYTFIDDGNTANSGKIELTPGTEYEYYVEAARDLSSPPPVSMPSETIRAYTHSDAEYPNIELKGLSGDKLIIFPDRTYDIQAKVLNAESFTFLSYQWQKYDIKKGWKDIKGNTTSVMSIENASMDEAGDYRCRIDAIYDDPELGKRSSVTAFTDVFSIAYRMRGVSMGSISAKCTDRIPDATVTLKPTVNTCLVAPSGNVNFIIEKDSIQKVYTVPLKSSGTTATASLADATDLNELEDGIYQIRAYYGGDAVFGSCSAEPVSMLVGQEAIYPVLSKANGERTVTFAYGDDMRIDFYRFTKDESGKTIEEKVADETNENGYYETLLKAPGVYENQKITVKLAGETTQRTFSYYYTVVKRPIEIGVLVQDLSKGDVEGKEPKAYVMYDDHPAGSDKLEDLVTLTFLNGNQTAPATINNNTAPGKYYAKLAAKAGSQAKAKNYELTLHSQEFVINATKYPVQISAKPVEGIQAGTVSMTVPEKINSVSENSVSYAAGTTVKLSAEPLTGYAFDHWTITEDGEETTLNTRNISRNIFAKNTLIDAYFRVYSFGVTVDEKLTGGGTVIKPEGFENGMKYPVGTKLEFEMQEADEVVPMYWVKIVGGRSYYIYGDTLEITMPESDVTIYPVFKGKPCTVSYNDNVVAYYTDINDQEEEITERVVSGKTVPKGSTILLKAGNGLVHYSWFVDGEKKAENKDYSFEIEKDTVIDLVPTQVANMPDPEIRVEYNIAKVGDIPLPENWKWDEEDAEIEIINGEEVSATAFYCGADAGNYENETIVITINRKECEHEHTETRDAKEATCVDDGYSGDIWCKDCNKKIEDGKTIKATGHEYGTPEYKWSEDGKNCTAVAVCKKEGCKDTDEGHILTEKASISEVVLDQPGSENQGATMYAAVFKKEPFILQLNLIGTIKQPAPVASSGGTPGVSSGTSSKVPVSAPGKVTSAKAKSKKAAVATISWKKVNGAAGYEVQLSLKKNFKKIAKNVSGINAKATVKKLKKGKTYYVRVRAYVLDASKNKVYGEYSDPVKVKIKK